MADDIEPGVQPPPSPWRRPLEWLDWRINPVLLRDLRLYTRGKEVIVAYFLALLTLVLMGVLYALVARIEEEDGRPLLSVLTTFLTVVCGSMIPNLVFERFRSELSNRATELALMSPLTPARLVRGKLMGAWCVALVVVSAAAPMLATSYLLGGVNALSIAAIVGGVLLAAAVMPTPQLFMATQRQGRSLSRGFAAMVFGVQLVLMIWYSSFLTSTFVEGGYREDYNLVIALAAATAGLLVAQFLYFNTVSRLQSESANRDLAPRLSLAFAVFGGGAAGYFLLAHLERMAGMASRSLSIEITGIVSCVMAYCFCLGFVVVSYSSPAPPRNLAAKWRRRPLSRLFLLPGMGSLAAYFLLCAAAILGVGLLGVLLDGFDDETAVRIACFVLAPFMAVSYGMIIYYYIVLRTPGDKRSPLALPVTIILSNIGLGVLCLFALVFLEYIVGKGGLYPLFLGSNPVGLVSAGIDSWRMLEPAVKYGLAFTFGSFLALLPMLLGGGERLLARGAKDTHAP